MRKLWAFNRRPSAVLDCFNGRGVRFDNPDQAALEAALGTPGTGAAGTGAAGTGSAAAAPAEKPKEDPEFELEFGEEGKKEKKKVKLSELHKGYMLNEDYTKKTQDIASEKEKIKDLLNWSEGVKRNPEAVKLILALSKVLETYDKDPSAKDRITKAIAVFEAKVETKKEETIEKIEDLEKELEGLDPASAEYKVAVRLLKQNQGLLKKLEDLEGKVEKTSGTVAKSQEDAEKKELEAAAQRASKVLSDTLAVLTDAKTGEVKLDSDEAIGLWRKLTLSHLRDNPKEYKNDDDFVAAIKDAGKKVFADIKKMSETTLAKYIKSKETPLPHKPGGSGDPTPKPMTMDNLQENIETALQEELNKK